MLNYMELLEAPLLALGETKSPCVTASRAMLLSWRSSVVATLVEAGADEFLKRCGLAPKLEALQTAEAEPQLRLSEKPGLEPLALAAAMRSFYAELFRMDGMLLPAAEGITSPLLRVQAVQECAHRLAATHHHINSLVRREDSGYKRPWAIVQQTPQEVETLLNMLPKLGGCSREGER